jgi:CheY-like chemotaxis protein
MAKILFAEDDRTIQKMINIALRSTPHDIRIMGDGAEAFEWIQRERPDVVFTDVSMPGMDGIQLVDAIKNHPDLRHIPVVLVTASVQRHQREEAYRHGIAGYLRKPFNINELREKVEEFASIAHRG